MSRIGRTPHHLARLAVTATLTLGLSACGGDAGSLPDFPYQDYSYTLGHECFCAAIDQRYRITVTDGEVSSITFATPGKGHQVGDPVDADYLRLTIQDIIDRGNDSKMAGRAAVPGQRLPRPEGQRRRRGGHLVDLGRRPGVSAGTQSL